jgi:hypothetical protein
MGWCSGTSIFDGVMDAIVPIVEPDHLYDIAGHIAELLWDSDWDCEADSKYYEELLKPLMIERGYIDEDDDDED